MTLSQNLTLLGALPAPGAIRLLLGTLVALLGLFLALACRCRIHAPPRHPHRHHHSGEQPSRSRAHNNGG